MDAEHSRAFLRAFFSKYGLTANNRELFDEEFETFRRDVSTLKRKLSNGVFSIVDARLDTSSTIDADYAARMDMSRVAKLCLTVEFRHDKTGRRDRHEIVVCDFLPYPTDDCTFVLDGSEEFIPPRELLSGDIMQMLEDTQGTKCSLQFSRTSFATILRVTSPCTVVLDTSELRRAVGKAFKLFDSENLLEFMEFMGEGTARSYLVDTQHSFISMHDYKSSALSYFVASARYAPSEKNVKRDARSKHKAYECLLKYLFPGENETERIAYTLAYMFYRTIEYKCGLRRYSGMYNLASRRYISTGQYIFDTIFNGINVEMDKDRIEATNRNEDAKSLEHSITERAGKHMNDLIMQKKCGNVTHILTIPRPSTIWLLSMLRCNIVPYKDIIRDHKLRVCVHGTLGFECTMELHDDSTLGLLNRMAITCLYSRTVYREDILGLIAYIQSDDAPCLLSIGGNVQEECKIFDAKSIISSSSGASEISIKLVSDKVEIDVETEPEVGQYDEVRTVFVTFNDCYVCHLSSTEMYILCCCLPQCKNGEYIRCERGRNMLAIYASRGKYVRPLIPPGVDVQDIYAVLDNTPPTEVMDALLGNGLVQLVDSAATEVEYVALEINDLTHFRELDPAYHFGSTQSLTPFLSYQPPARSVFSTSLMRHTIPSIVDDHFRRSKTLNMKNLVSPQRPIVSTVVADTIHEYYPLVKEHSRLKFDGPAPFGVNIVLAIHAMGANVEDAVIVNKASLERGMFHSISRYTQCIQMNEFRSVATQAMEIGKNREGRYLGGVLRHKRFEHHVLNYNSTAGGNAVEAYLPAIDSYVDFDDIMCMCIKDDGTKFKIERSGVKIPAVVKNIQAAKGSKGVTIYIRLEVYKQPSIGDKMSPRCGQKGVISMIVPQEDLLFTEDGIVPDAVINTHAMPSRTTCNHVLEMLQATIGASRWSFVDGSPFREPKLYKPVGICNDLRSVECLDRHFRDGVTTYDGTTGEMMDDKVFMGLITYSTMEQQSHDKVKPGRMPQSGRRDEMHYGEMEVDATIAIGMSSMLKEVIARSDRTRVYICRDCGMIHQASVRKCVECKSEQFDSVLIPTEMMHILNVMSMANVSTHAHTRLSTIN